MLNGIGVNGGISLTSLYLYRGDALEVFIKDLYNTKAVNVKTFLGFIDCIVGIRNIIITLILPSYSLTSFLALPNSFKKR